MSDQSLAKYQCNLRHAPYPQLLVGSDGEVLAYNAAAAGLLGWPEEGSVGNIGVLLPDPERSWMAIPPGESATWEAEARLSTREPVIVSATAGPAMDDGMRMVALTDLTEDKLRERRLYALWEFSSVVSTSLDLTLLLENVSVEVSDLLNARRVEFVLIQPKSGTVQARAVYEAASGAPHIRLYGPEESDPQSLSTPVRHVLSDPAATHIRFEDDPDQDVETCSVTVPMVARGVTIGAFTAEGCALQRHLANEHVSLCHAIANQTAVAADNARLLQVEIDTRKEIARLQDYYRAILDNSPDGLFVTDTEGVVRFWNQRMEDLFGIPGAGILHRDLFGTADYWQGHSKSFQSVVERHEPARVERQSRENHNGESVVENIYFLPLWHAGQLDGVMGLVTDVTEQSQLERQLINSERMAAVGELAAGVAHNFNNILASIGGDAQLLRMIAEEDKLGDTVINSAEMIYRETMRGGRIAHDLLSFARGQEPCLSEVDVSTLVGEAVRLAKTYPSATRIDLRHQVAPDLPRVSADPNQLHQVIFNIILNAIQAMPQGGTLTIDARVVTGDDGRARMDVMFEDTGVGIPPEHLSRIFDPFFSNRHGNGTGTGLGLSVSLSMVRGMEGDIRVMSEVGRGTLVSVSLPIVERRRRPRLGEQPKPRILIADDEPNIRRTLSTFLSRRGYHVVAARDGAEAVGILNDPESTFRLVLLDLVMPRLSGIDTIRRVREMRPNLPIVVLTGVASADELEQVKKLGVVRSLCKPVDFDELLRTVEDTAGPAAIPVLTR